MWQKMSDPFDKLLFILSKRQKTRWPVFREIFGALYADLSKKVQNSPSLTDLRIYTVRAFQTLGHIEVVFDEDGGYVYVAPPALVRLPKIGLPEFVLCGARSPETVADLVEVARHTRSDVEIEVDSRVLIGPKRVVVKADTTAQVQQIASDLGIRFQLDPAAWRLANYSGSLVEYLDSRIWTYESDINWVRADFNPQALQFERRPLEGRNLSRYQDPVRTIYRYFLWNSGKRAEVNLDWGRYAALNLAEVNVLSYNPQDGSFWVPVSTPLPPLLNRALGLCTGKPPVLIKREPERIHFQGALGFYKYEAIPHYIATLVAQKVSQPLQAK
jgi:hypothetical protein